MLFDLSSLLWPGLLGNYEVVNDNPLADATALIVFPNRPTDRPGGVGRVGRGNEKTAPETSVPRGPPPPPPRRAVQAPDHWKSYVCTSEHRRSRRRFYCAVSERERERAATALLRRSLLREFLFRFPLSGIDAACVG
jgi:hypothetical protein